MGLLQSPYGLLPKTHSSLSGMYAVITLSIFISSSDIIMILYSEESRLDRSLYFIHIVL